MRVDPRLYEGLCNIVNRSQHKPALLMLYIGKAGDQDHRNALGNDLLLQFFEQCKTIHSRHDHIEQDQGEGSRTRIHKPLFSRLRNGNLVIILQNRPKLRRIQTAVVNNQYLFHISPHPSGCTAAFFFV